MATQRRRNAYLDFQRMLGSMGSRAAPVGVAGGIGAALSNVTKLYMMRQMMKEAETAGKADVLSEKREKVLPTISAMFDALETGEITSARFMQDVQGLVRDTDIELDTKRTIISMIGERKRFTDDADLSKIYDQSLNQNLRYVKGLMKKKGFPKATLLDAQPTIPDAAQSVTPPVDAQPLETLVDQRNIQGAAPPAAAGVGGQTIPDLYWGMGRGIRQAGTDFDQFVAQPAGQDINRTLDWLRTRPVGQMAGDVWGQISGAGRAIGGAGRAAGGALMDLLRSRGAQTPSPLPPPPRRTRGTSVLSPTGNVDPMEQYMRMRQMGLIP